MLGRVDAGPSVAPAFVHPSALPFRTHPNFMPQVLRHQRPSRNCAVMQPPHMCKPLVNLEPSTWTSGRLHVAVHRRWPGRTNRWRAIAWSSVFQTPALEGRLVGARACVNACDVGTLLHVAHIVPDGVSGEVGERDHGSKPICMCSSFVGRAGLARIRRSYIEDWSMTMATPRRRGDPSEAHPWLHKVAAVGCAPLCVACRCACTRQTQNVRGLRQDWRKVAAASCIARWLVASMSGGQEIYCFVFDNSDAVRR